MTVKQAVFVTSVANAADLLKDKPEFVFAGKSNVGKSSLINLITNNKKLAITSKTPGRTRLINYFLINNSFYFVDLPGYGYAKSSKEAKEKFSDLIESYFSISKNIKTVFLLIDIRNGATQNDLDMISFCTVYNLAFVIIATKCDKIPASRLHFKKQELAGQLKVGINNIIATSTLEKKGATEILQLINNKLEQ